MTRADNEKPLSAERGQQGEVAARKGGDRKGEGASMKHEEDHKRGAPIRGEDPAGEMSHQGRGQQKEETIRKRATEREHQSGRGRGQHGEDPVEGGPSGGNSNQ
jgi:hypothetical protein